MLQNSTKGDDMKRFQLHLVCIAFAVLVASVVYAKRAAPVDVTPVVSGSIEYRAPRDHMGSVEAWNAKSNKLIWRRQIYVVKYTLQDVFIKTMKLKGGTLVVKNERGSEYELDLNTLEIKVLKGLLVENRK